MFDLALVYGSPFWSQFWPDLVATLVGAFVGIGLALRADHAREWRARGAQEAALLRAARDAVAANLTLCGQLKVILGQGVQLPSFEMDVGLLDAILPRLVELSVDTKLLGELGNFRYQLHHTNRKLDHLPDDAGRTNAAGALARNAGSILGTIAALEGSGQQTLPPLFEARIASLEQPARGLRRFV